MYKYYTPLAFLVLVGVILFWAISSNTSTKNSSRKKISPHWLVPIIIFNTYIVFYFISLDIKSVRSAGGPVPSAIPFILLFGVPFAGVPMIVYLVSLFKEKKGNNNIKFYE